MNNIHLIGRLGADPEIIPYTTKHDRPDEERFLVRFDIAVDQPWRPGRDDKPDPDWIPIVIFHGPNARYARQSFAKGELVAITGRLEQQKWTDDDNNKRSSLRVVAAEIKRLSFNASGETDAQAKALEDA